MGGLKKVNFFLKKCISSHELIIMTEFCGVNLTSNFGFLKKEIHPTHEKSQLFVEQAKQILRCAYLHSSDKTSSLKTSSSIQGDSE